MNFLRTISKYNSNGRNYNIGVYKNIVKSSEDPMQPNKPEPAQRFLGSIVRNETILDMKFVNEPILEYRKGSKEREKLRCTILEKMEHVQEIPIVIGGKEMKSSDCKCQVMPHNHGKTIAKYFYATSEMLEHAICVATEAQKKWNNVPFCERIKIWLKAADLMAKDYRQILNAATVLGQSKTFIQAEIDSAAELIDFFRMSAYTLNEVLKYKPISVNPKISKNSLIMRGLDGFIAAVTPFNFTAIGGNLSYTPALVGNAVLWKPSDTAMLSNWEIFQICRQAGVPDGVVNFVPADPATFGKVITQSKYLAGINFTGSVPTFNYLWKEIAKNIDNYKNYPKLAGECGGKNYHFVHPTADVETVASCTIRSAFEYCGQKCSACSRMYVPESLWNELKCLLLSKVDKLKVGDPADPKTFMGAVIDKKSFKRIVDMIEYAKECDDLRILYGGDYECACGYFVYPTIIETSNPYNKIMTKEIFGPVLSIYVYKDCDISDVFKIIEESTPYALTGAIFANDQKWLQCAAQELKVTAGNFYVNDKCTGSVVGQQPFGGSRKSGTNDKPGGPHYILRWMSPQSIKETFVPMTDVSYPYMRD